MTDQQIRSDIIGALSVSMMSMEKEAECIAFLDRCIEASQSGQWTSVAERLPVSGERVIVCRGDKVEQGIYLGVNGWWKVYGTNTKAVTHWQPMPAAPKEA